MSRILITGALGNLGFKLLCHLVTLDQITEVVGLDIRLPNEAELASLKLVTPPRNTNTDKARFITADLTDPTDARWRDALNNIDAVVHFAARNPYPEANWSESNASLDMTLNLALAAVEKNVRRFIFASSNHVMGGYLNEPLASSIGAGGLTTSLDHAVGTKWHTGVRDMDSTIYAVSKSSGERICRALGNASKGKTSFVSIRIGWCQPGENLKTTLSAAGTVTQPRGPGEETPADIWFRNMWLSNRDFSQLFEKALFADRAALPEPAVVVNGVSNNTGMKWSLDEGRQYLNYNPVDDVNS